MQSYSRRLAGKADVKTAVNCLKECFKWPILLFRFKLFDRNADSASIYGKQRRINPDISAPIVLVAKWVTFSTTWKACTGVCTDIYEVVLSRSFKT